MYKNWRQKLLPIMFSKCRKIAIIFLPRHKYYNNQELDSNKNGDK